MQEAYKIGNAQSIGSYQIQSNYFASCCISDSCFAVLADGTADHANGRRCAILAVEACMHQFHSMPKETPFSEFTDFVTAKILKDIHEIIFLGKTPYLSVSFLLARGSSLHYYSAGSNQVFLYDGRDYQRLEGSGRAYFRKGMTAGIISRGVWEAINEREIVSLLAKREHPYGKAQRMIISVKEKNKKAAGNATVLLIEGCL